MMNKAIISSSGEEVYTGFEITGHAGYAAAGYDIVCASISVLAQHTVMALKDIAFCALSKDIIEYGHVECEISYSDLVATDEECTRIDLAQSLFLAMENSIRAIEEGYKENVKLCVQVVRTVV